jgi:glycosyltransferase involved in cell wall biosynthesis
LLKRDRPAEAEHRPRILHLLHSSAIGGGPNSVRMLALGTRADFEPIVVSSGEGDLPRQLAAGGVEFHALPLATKWSFFVNTWRLARLIRSIRPEAIHLHGHFAASIGQLAVFLAGRPPTVYSVRWPAYLSDKSGYTRARNWLVERFSCVVATVVVAISEHDNMTLLRRRICPPGKLRMIHNAFAVVPPQPLADSLASDIVTIGFVGRLVDQKGCEDLISAFGVLVAERAPVRLMLVGDGPMRPRLERRVRELGLAGRVEFLGLRPDGPALMASMDVVAVPSLFEPFGIVAVEAMVQARPVVASAVGGLTETVEDGVTGRLVPAGNPQRLADALRDVVRSSEMRVRMGQAARHRALDLFAPELTIAAYSQIYAELTANSDPPATNVSGGTR